MHTRRRAIAASVAVLALSYGTLGCGDDDTTSADTAETTETQSELTPATDRDRDRDQDGEGDRDRDRDRDQIHDAIGAISAACQGDQDRLRDMVGDQLRDQVQDRLRDQSCLLDESDDVEVTEEDIQVDGDTATARFTFQHRHRGELQEDAMTWRFRWTEQDGWVLDDLDSLFAED
ncbi:MAG TPA: hypothetical protein VLR27_00805 [Acidimicrobiales bacterium]|nr:hypothetical protein [Acidimicrobiales bacterium]